MQNDDVIWQVLRHEHCSYMSKITAGIFCQNPYNVTGVCNRSSCPLANSRYATIRDHGGVFYLYMKTTERAHMPNKLWERIKLPHNYEQELKIIDQNLGEAKVMTLPRKEIKRESRREEKAQTAAQVDKNIEKELIARLIARVDPEITKPKAQTAAQVDKNIEKEVIARLIARVNPEISKPIIDKIHEYEVEYVEGDYDEEFEFEDFCGRTTEGYGLDDDDDIGSDDDDDEEAVDVNRKRGRADSKYNLKKKEKDAKKKGRVLVEVEHEDSGRRQEATLSI